MREQHQPRLSLKKKQAGLTLVEVVMVMGAMVFVASLTGTLYLQMSQSQRRTDFDSQLTTLRDFYVNMITNDDAWDLSVADAGNPMACLKNNTKCVAMTLPNPPLPQGYRMVPRLSDNTHYLGYDPVTNPNQGFTRDGTLCSTWVDGVPDINCPIRIDFIWQPLCPQDVSLGCKNPESDVTVFFRVQLPMTPGMAAVNTAKFTRTIRRKGSITIPVLSACPGPNDVIIGFDLSGQPVCVDGATVAP